MLDDAGIGCNRNMHPEIPNVEIQLILLISEDTQKKKKYAFMV